MTPYITIVEAEDYFAAVLDTYAWDNADTATKEKALLAATIKIDLLPFIDEKLDQNQEHAFPRTGQVEVPQRVKWATAELALNLLDGLDGDKNYKDNAVSSEGYSSVRVNYKEDFYEVHSLLGLPSKKVYDLLAPWLDLGLYQVNLIRST